MNISGFEGFAMEFEFSKTEENTLIFARKDKLFKFNYENGQITNIYHFKVSLKIQPMFFLLNTDQNISLTASKDDGIYYNQKTDTCIDIDKELAISNIVNMIYEP